MTRYKLIFSLICVIVFCTQVYAQNASSAADHFWDEVNKLGWKFAGSQGQVGAQATIQVRNGYAFLDSPGSKRFLELQGNPPRDNRYVIAAKDLHWFGVFLFEPIGYVKDDEKIDPDTLLATMREHNKVSNEERKTRGLESLTLEGWFIPPHYDVQTKRLEWGTRLKTEKNEIVVNYTIKLLGRAGVMDAILVSDPRNLDADVRDFKSVLSDFSFNAGQRYTEFRSGDKVAEYGLAALIVGGAAAAAAKSGALKGLLKFVGVGVLAAGGAAWAFLKRLFRRA